MHGESARHSPKNISRSDTSRSDAIGLRSLNLVRPGYAHYPPSLGLAAD